MITPRPLLEAAAGAEAGSRRFAVSIPDKSALSGTFQSHQHERRRTSTRGYHTSHRSPAAQFPTLESQEDLDDMASTPHPFADDILLVFYVGDPSAEFIAKLEGRYPGLKVRWLNVMTEDGQIRTALDFPAESFEGVTMLFAYHPVPAHLVPKLRFVQLTSAGSDLWASHEKFLDRKTIFCTTSGAQA